MIPHPKWKVFLRGISSLKYRNGLKPWEGEIFRYVPSRFSKGSRLIDGVGSFRGGGRWCFPGALHAVCCSSTAGLAHLEYLHQTRSAGISAANLLPVTGKAIHLDLARTLDLRRTRVLEALGVTIQDLTRDDWLDRQDAGRESLCQAIGRAALKCGVDALLVPSALPGVEEDYNCILIRENLPDDRIRVLRSKRK